MPTVNEIPRVDTTCPPALGGYATEALERVARALFERDSLTPELCRLRALIECELRRRTA